MTNLAKTPKSAIFWNSTENRGSKSMRFKCNHWTTFCRQPRLQKCQQFRAMAIFAKTPKWAIFWNSSNGGPRVNGLKSRPSSQAPKKPRRKSHRPFISMRFKCNHWTTFFRKTRLQKCRQFWAMANLAKKHQNRPFFEILQRGDQGRMA